MFVLIYLTIVYVMNYVYSDHSNVNYKNKGLCEYNYFRNFRIQYFYCFCKICETAESLTVTGFDFSFFICDKLIYLH